MFCGDHATVRIEGGNLSSCQAGLQAVFNWQGCHQRGHKEKRCKAHPAVLCVLQGRGEPRLNTWDCLCVSRKLHFRRCQISTELTFKIIENQKKLFLFINTQSMSYLQSAVRHNYIYTVT